MKLSNATLGSLPEGIKRPTYDRTALTPGIVHIGLGNFHRAHQAWYLHQLMQLGHAQDWAILGAGVRPYDAAMRDRLKAQDCLTTLIELDPKGQSAEVTGSMIDYIEIVEGNRPLIDAMTREEICIVALTVTEGGYYVTANGDFDEAHADILHDAANPDTPRTAFGAIVCALKARKDAGTGPFTLQSCDNLQGNGDILRQTVVGLARLSDRNLAAWIEESCTFPNSMVDCIVPATGAKEVALAKELGIDDAAPVTHENFRQWVIEDSFCAGRPEWELAGATFTDDVHVYEAMKIRILNAGHQVLANAAEILSLPTIASCMQDEDVSAFFAKVEAECIVPYVHPVPGMAPTEYADLIARRFANPMIHDTTRRVAFDGSSRHTGFLLPILRDAIAARGSIEGLSLVEALWARMCSGQREDGTVIEPNDPMWEALTEAAMKAKEDPAHWLEQHQIYGDLALHGSFSESFAKWLNMLWRDGTRATLNVYLAS
ncbi:mannitol 2-dehydrogenase [Sagittula marina]|uniref:Mannitol 2-dehydrogenase n=1 Tax=Sagittula marina TaxID=943940 RepID=A0A7W6GSG5_9RHOB|nr:mannitol dehydrogenase family protein [Sagittula marina]MBB3985757.1 mannitol 2-dehydrogenase [Sagittula marina]